MLVTYLRKYAVSFAAIIVAMLSFPELADARRHGRPEDWQDASVSSCGRLPMRASFKKDCPVLSIHGMWKFKWNETPESRLRDFYAVDTDDSGWDKMPVPGIWEMNGYGDPLYVNIGYCWKGQFENNPPFVPSEKNHVGQYRRNFIIPSDWEGKQIVLHVGSATSNLRVWINGHEAGYSEDSKLEACFDITRYVRPGKENLIAMEIFRWCDGTYLEDQDFWKLSGIARESYLYARDKAHVEDINVRADADGNFCWTILATKDVKSLVVSVPGLGYECRAERSAVRDGLRCFEGKALFDGVRQWSAEDPFLYEMKVVACSADGVTERDSLKIGFRTVEVDGNLLLVNGRPVLIKGVNRHEMNPYSAYVIPKEDMVRDIRIMKELNINTVRTCHYPDDPYWYELCDEYGLYVIDEANNEAHGLGYEETAIALNPMYHDAIIERVERMMRRDMNHPSVIVWSLGNEAGNGPNFIDAYDFAKTLDVTRPVQYERAGAGYNTDIYCPMYTKYWNAEKYILEEQDRPFIMCEYAHAMGNSMGGFKEYWDMIRKYPSFQGGCIWDFADQALYKPVDASRYGTDHVFAFGGDWNDEDPSDASFNCNGLVASDRTWHPHAFEVRYQHRPIISSATPDEAMDGLVHVFNEYFFIDLDRYSLCWEIECNGNRVLEGFVPSVAVSPQTSSEIRLGFDRESLTESCREIIGCDGDLSDADVYLNLHWRLNRKDGLLPAGTELAYDQIAISEGWRPEVCPVPEYAEVEVGFDRVTGALSSYKVAGREMLAGPVMPCFGRAVTDNDEGMLVDPDFMDEAAKMFEAWRSPSLELESFSDSAAEDGCRVVKAVYSPVNDWLRPEMTWRIGPDGTIRASLRLADAGSLAEAPHLFRVGVEMAMPGEYSVIDFYGDGPFETYSDRRSSAFTGHYVQNVCDQYHYGYVRPQESGTHVGLKWLKIIDGNGKGLMFTSSAPEFSASALPFSRKHLDRHPEYAHSLELKAEAHEDDRTNGLTYLNLDLMQMGLGCISSFGDHPLDEYMIIPQEYVFDFTVSPVL